jgi:hypothetical protein
VESAVLEDANSFWMAHKSHTMSEVYSHLHEELQMRLDEAARVGYGFALPAPENVQLHGLSRNCPKCALRNCLALRDSKRGDIF